MTKMTALLERNEQFARTYTPAALGIPAQQVLIVTRTPLSAPTWSACSPHPRCHRR